MAEERIPHPELADRIERLIGVRVESYRVVTGGYSPALRLRCETAVGSFFAKVGAVPPTDGFLRREITVYQRLRGPFLPNLVAYDASEVEPILIIEDLSTHHWPPPWNERRVAQAREQIAALHGTSAALEPFAEVHAESFIGAKGWQAVAADPEPFLSLGFVEAAWLDVALPVLLENEARCSTAGDSLCHWDLRSDNMCFTADRAVFIDWNLACQSNPKLDLGFLLPSLAYEGGPQPETILPDAPEVAAWVSGFFAGRAGLPLILHAPRVRIVQRQQLETALSWAVRALDLPPTAIS
jgi:hypothetical protein